MRLIELKKLLDKISLAKLGSDWQTRKELEYLESRVIRELKSLL